jgi:O-antigen ligase/tetratricopeptide (TPR) repeat protein
MKTAPTLGFLRALALGLALFAYTSVRPLRVHPPVLLLIQLTVLVTLCGWWGWKVFRRRGLPCSPVALPLLALVGAAALSTLFSVDPRLSLTGMLGTLTLVLLFFVLCDLLLAGWAPGTLIDSVLLLATLLIGQGLWMTADWYRSWWQMRVPEYPVLLLQFRLYRVAEHPNLLAPLIYMALPFAIVRLAQARSAGGRLAYGLWLAAATVVLFFTRSRGGWVGTSVVVAITVVWLLLQRRPPRLGRAGWLRGTWRVWLVTAAYLALFTGLLALDARLSQSEYTTSGGSVASMASRPLFWRVAWESFTSQPLTGRGPLTYPRSYVSSTDRIRAYVSSHAHNVILDELAERGIVGLLAAGWLLAVAALALVRGWRSPPGVDGHQEAERHPLLLCVGAGLLGTLVHGQVEVPFWLPSNALVAIILLAVGVHAAGALQPGREGLTRWRAAGFLVPLVLVLTMGRLNAGQVALSEAIGLASEGDWHGAARALDAAVAADPAFSFHQAQRGYAYGVVADPLTAGGDPAALAPALDSYRLALQSAPEYVPYLLNTAWLLEQGGSSEEAEGMLAAAVERGADWALPALWLGDRYANQGRAAEAEALFATAFAREPQAQEMAACRASAACRQAAERIPPKADAIAQAHERAQALLAQGRPEDALAALQAVPIASEHPLPWLDRADAHLMLGQLAQARYALNTAWILGAGRLSHNGLSQAAYHLARGQRDNAIAALERVARPQIGNIPYDAVVFQQIGLPGTLLPSVAMLQRTVEDLAVYRQLAQLYAGEGRSGDAAWAEEQATVLAALLAEATDGR